MAIPGAFVNIAVPDWVYSGSQVVITVTIDNTSDVTQNLGFIVRWQVNSQWFNASSNLNPVPSAGVSQFSVTFAMPSQSIYVGLAVTYIDLETYKVEEGDPVGPYFIDIVAPEEEPPPPVLPPLPPIDNGPWYIPAGIRDLIAALPGGSILLWPHDLAINTLNYLAPLLQEARNNLNTAGGLASSALTKIQDWLNQVDPWFNIKISDWAGSALTLWSEHLRAEREASEASIWSQIWDLTLTTTGLKSLVEAVPEEIANAFLALPNTEPFKSAISMATSAFNVVKEIPDVIFSLPDWFPKFITNPLGFALDLLDSWLDEEVEEP